MPRPDNPVLAQLTALLKGGQAHASFDDAVKGLPVALRGKVPAGLPYSAWQLVEHIRIAQRDILDFSRNRSYGNAARPNPKARPSPYQSMAWPDDYWPKSPAPPSAAAWSASLKAIRNDRDAFLKLLRAATPESLHTPFPWAKGHGPAKDHTLFAKALLIADHNSYHTGELIAVRRLLGAWK